MTTAKAPTPNWTADSDIPVANTISPLAVPIRSHTNRQTLLSDSQMSSIDRAMATIKAKLDSMKVATESPQKPSKSQYEIELERAKRKLPKLSATSTSTRRWISSILARRLVSRLWLTSSTSNPACPCPALLSTAQIVSEVAATGMGVLAALMVALTPLPFYIDILSYSPNCGVLNGRGGCESLQEVFWMVPSNLWRPEQGKINESTGLCSATTNGLTKGLYIKGENRWAGDNMPTFKFVSLAPLGGKNGKFYDTLGVNSAGANYLCKYMNGKLIRDIEFMTKCKIEVTEQTCPGEDPGEIGFVGSEQDIKKAKQAVIDKIITSENGRITNVRPIKEIA
ncbi:hypothetical protein G7Y89_g2362 [Cudoniella acicularis]|uniref:Uncharacterized protein n=1 Tax=Cudoniella acicularis TaxID=354080 RepID=A0A8H4RTG3_9HELO|nr:hypothetical protein G7Y89_g2362 [Cudoniella acicularis]